jgi:alkanesulfonate monooxygenase SsuD/methylene tetrahydromethanopterin reductase-like flavin-dependent oxidoreductase (luciferase family)
MLDLAGRTADIVGIHARMNGDVSDQAAAVTDLTAASIAAKVERIRAAAADAGRPTPRLQFSCYYVHVTDALEASGQRSSWAAHVEAEMDSLKDSPAVLVGTAKECAEKLLEWRERFGITYWHLGPDVDAVRGIVELLRSD